MRLLQALSKFAASKSLIRNVRAAFSQTPLTSDTYKVERGNYGEIASEDISIFSDIVGCSHVVADPSDLEGNNIDWLKTVRGQSKLMVKPKSTKEVSEILKHCNERNLAVCPQGGNTGLVGGSVPVFDEVILSTQRMNKIISIDPISGVLVCQAGCILETANKELAGHGLIAPLDLGAKGSCHLGGNISTNAGGLRLLRYGSLRGTVLGVEAVLSDGKVLDCLSTLRKDNTGYDLKQLMIGSEGTLGVVTALSILCPQKPASVNVAFLGVESFEKVLKIQQCARKDLGEILSAVEFMDSECMRNVTHHLNMTNPIADCPFYILIETSGSNASHDEEKLGRFLEEVMDAGIADDGTLATDYTKMEAIWGLRERMAEAMLHDGYNFKYDFSLPTDKMYDLVRASREHLKGICKSVVGYGHLGDGNLHLNITCEKYSRDIHSAVEPFVYEWTSRHKGSVSAEHGLGFKKRQYMAYTKSKEEIMMMKKIKQLFDPKGILNPYKMLPDNF
ncbi:D-2-hydroxyglutarate dehydrogenase, mitochondrial-like [Clavelina lepadiformis]|uniref:D-2-hydroxyglutarate dehydrogenase, mitochondrial-like n=1 Tax=Clavelina lepadiformis TaxID=159417 RepID=UPI0040410290